MAVPVTNKVKHVRIVVADDHEVVRKGLALLLALQPDLDVVGEVSTGPEAIEAVRRLQPDVLLLDLKMPGLDGLSVTSTVKRASPTTRVLMLSALSDGERVLEALRCGADGYLSKDVSPDVLLGAIQTVMQGRRFLPPHLVAPLADVIASSPALKRPQPALSERECDVLRLLATSHTNRVIAEQLCVSEETVRSHIKSILRKLDQPNRTQAVVAGIRLGLIDLSRLES